MMYEQALNEASSDSQVSACVVLCDVVIRINRDRDDNRNKRNSWYRIERVY